MRRRVPPLAVLPPAELLDLDPAVWLDRVPGPADPLTVLSADDWRFGEAVRLWSAERLAWVESHGWPGGWDKLDVMRDAVVRRRRAYAAWAAAH